VVITVVIVGEFVVKVTGGLDMICEIIVGRCLSLSLGLGLGLGLD